jgi:hypothetical protein
LKGALAAVGALSMVLARGAQAATPPLRERGPWRAWMLPHAITGGLPDARDVSIAYR